MGARSLGERIVLDVLEGLKTGDGGSVDGSVDCSGDGIDERT
jgi:hypothetical protein